MISEPEFTDGVPRLRRSPDDDECAQRSRKETQRIFIYYNQINLTQLDVLEAKSTWIREFSTSFPWNPPQYLLFMFWTIQLIFWTLSSIKTLLALLYFFSVLLPNLFVIVGKRSPIVAPLPPQLVWCFGFENQVCLVCWKFNLEQPFALLKSSLGLHCCLCPIWDYLRICAHLFEDQFGSPFV